MKTTILSQSTGRLLVVASIPFVAVIMALTTAIGRAESAASIIRPGKVLRGQSYSQWSAKWWQWAMSQPLAGHPFNDDPAFNVANGQSGNVWFLATPFGHVERHVTIPSSKALVIGLLNAEASDIEGLGATEAEQRDTARYLADHIVNVACSIDGDQVRRIEGFRVGTPQFSFNAPSPWIFGETGGSGTSVGDGYFVMLNPLSEGSHTVRIQGSFHFSISEGDPFDFDAAADVTYFITIADSGDDQ
jgi:hypothetical protein